jgi:hypothetical protein
MAINESQSLEDLRCGYWELVAARPAYERAAAFYEGTVDEVYSSPKVTRLLAKFGLDAIESFNFAHIPVDAVANKLRLNNVNADKEGNEEGEVTQNEEVNSVIDDLWEYNELDEELPTIFRNTGKYGDAYVMVWPVVGEETDANVTRGFDPQKTAKQLVTGDTVTEDDVIEARPVTRKTIVAVDILPLDPFTTRVFYDTENPKKKTYAIRSWVEGGKGDDMVVRVNLYYPDRIERWMHKGKPSKRKNAQQKWVPYVQDGNAAVLPNPFGEVPIFHFRTDRTYGRPDHVNAYGPQLAINKLVTSHLATVDYQSFPQRYALLDPMADQSGLNGADSDPFAPEDEDQDPEDDDNDSQLEADPAAVWQFSGMKTVGQFESADADAFLKPFDRYVKALAQATDTPFHYFDRQGERPPSGENIRQVNEFLNSKAGFRQTSYGGEIKKFTTLALTMMGQDVERINIEWEPLEVVTDFVEWQAVNEKIAAGVPTEIALIEAGYRPALVYKWKKEREAAAEDALAQEIEQQRLVNAMKHDINPAPDVRYAEHNPQKPGSPSTPKTSSSTGK